MHTDKYIQLKKGRVSESPEEYIYVHMYIHTNIQLERQTEIPKGSYIHAPKSHVNYCTYSGT